MTSRVTGKTNLDRDQWGSDPGWWGPQWLLIGTFYNLLCQDECSFVSLRDVERAVQVTSWFYKKMDLIMPLLDDEEENEDQPDVIGNDSCKVSTKTFTCTFSNFKPI